MPRSILIEGFTPDEIAQAPASEFEELIFTGEPFIFKAGSAEILGEFKIANERLIIELAHIDGGGEGVLMSLWLLADKLARKHHLQAVEWIVYAVDCANPNLGLRHLLERRGFTIQQKAEKGSAYYYLHPITNES